ncbi:hypothetical protein B0T19DRAFT_416221 [Cercophora scortea]|uniref:Uncharacterized protein n=1 Tax=Cercophora scortea TaxID=314031 RepID=A0AAE0IWS1_9PEZI|nr:hypothetical protein B0T19DRAFT_416221 [Cercophora scortea]
MLVIHTAADLVSIMADANDSQRTGLIEKKARNVMGTIRALAQQVVCSAEDMECADGEGVLRLPGLLPAVETLNIAFHKLMRDPIFTWAKKRGYSIDVELQRGPTVVWFKSGGMTCGNDMVVMLIVVPRPKRSGGVEKDVEGIFGTTAAEQEVLSTGIIKSPVGGPIFVDSPFECQVGDMIILEEGEQILVKETTGPGNPKDFCVLCAVHSTTKKNEV